MKCDHIRTREQGDTPFFPNMLNNGNVEVCLKEDVDAAIAELKAENAQFKKKLDKAIAERDGNQVCIDALKAKLEDVQASAYAESVDAGMRERRLRRALYKACANWAHHRVFVRFKTNEKAWEKVERKCRAKMEEYK